MIRVKVCGMQTAEDVVGCVTAGVDALGFIFTRSPRRLSVERAAAIARRAPPFVARVGVFGNDDAALIRAAIERCGLHWLQFSAFESLAFCGSFGLPTIVVVPADGPALSAAALRHARAGAVMLDGRSDGQLGGTGHRVPVGAAVRARRDYDLPLVLAGGLKPGNVAQAVRSVKPFAVDVRSGVERAGRIDPTLVRRFVSAAKGAD